MEARMQNEGFMLETTGRLMQFDHKDGQLKVRCDCFVSFSGPGVQKALQRILLL